MAETRFEHIVKNQVGKDRLDNIDMYVISMFGNSKGHPDCSAEEIAESKKIIAEKQIDISFLGMYFWNGRTYKGYNANVGKAWMCISKEQWQLLDKYLKGYWTEGE